MPNQKGPRGSVSRRVAISGVFVALAVGIMAVGGVIPIAVFTAPGIAGLCLMPIAMECGNKTAMVGYVATCILSFLWVPDREMVFFFIFILGFYPVLQPYLGRIKHKVPQYAAKFALFNLAVGAIYSVLLFLLAVPALREEFAGAAKWFWACLLVAANLTFFLYDILVTKLRFIYICRFKGRLFR